MSRIALGLCLAVPLFANGCANFIETQAITRFAEALEDKNLAELKSQTTAAFEQKALRRDDALQDFEILNLPEGKVKIDKVEDVSKDEKRVIAEVGEKKIRLQYRLVRDEKSNKWLVDDITVKQKKSNITAAKSVSDQMDLLLSVREFVAACNSAERDRILAAMTPELKTLVEGLPPACLAKLTDRVVDKKGKKRTSRPNAQMNDGTALVELPRDRGEVVVSFKLIDNNWKVSDVGVESRKQKSSLPSLQKTATVMKTVFGFLDAYAASNREVLAHVCTPKLYKHSLELANLSEIPLPSSAVAADKHEIVLDNIGADFVVNGEKEVVQIALDRREKDDPDQATEFVVKEVTIYPLDSRQNKRLSAAFNAHSIVRNYSLALAQRELPMLRRASTINFKDRVWQNLDDVMVLDMPLAEFDGTPPRIVETLFNGALTEVTVEQGVNTMTYVLRERNGDVKVDDVIYAVPNRPPSLKESLEAVMPVVRYMQAIRMADMKGLQRNSSTEFNRLAWSQLDSMPPLCQVVLTHLQQPVTGVQRGTDSATIIVGDDMAGARVTMKREHEHYVIDEIQLIAGTQPHQRPSLRQTVRTQIAEGRIRSRQAASTSLQQGAQANAVPMLQGSEPTGTAVRSSRDLIQPSDDAFTPPDDSRATSSPTGATPLQGQTTSASAIIEASRVVTNSGN